MTGAEIVEPEVIIDFRVPLDDGSFANTVAEPGTVDKMYPVNREDDTRVYVGAEKTDPLTGAKIVPFNSALTFKDTDDGRRAILRNTVPRLCPVGECGSCVLKASGLTIDELSEKNCARANTTVAFEMGGAVEPRSRFVLLPTSRDGLVVTEDSFTPEFNGDGQLMHNRLKPGYSAVFTETWLREQGLTEFAIGAHGADGTVGVATVLGAGETLYVPFFSLRQNMGDRGVNLQIMYQALNAYYDSQGYDQVRRDEINRGLQVSFTFAASATLPNFAHKVNLPEPGSDKEAEIRATQAHLIARAGGRITTAIVLNHEYAGAMERGHVWPELEAKGNRLLPNPVSPNNCPLDGQTCHVDYREETRYALRKQLMDMGVPEHNILFDEDDNVFDPGSPDNNAATNRAEQNNGVKDAMKVNRTLNALLVKLPPEPAYA